MTEKTLYTYVVDDTSPMFSYNPYGTSDESTGWQGYFSQVETNTTTNHFTGFIGSTLSLEFYGSSITLYGTFNGTFEVMLDGNLMENDVANSTENILYSWNGTIPASEPGTHKIELMAFPGRYSTKQIVFDNATITTEVLTDLTVPNITTYESGNNVFTYAGLWGPDVVADTRVTSEPADVVSLNFTGSVIEVWGPTDTNSGYYSIKLNDRQWVFNSYSPVAVPDAQLFYMNGLSEKNESTITMRKLDGNQTHLRFGRMVVTQFNASSGVQPDDGGTVIPLPQATSSGSSGGGSAESNSRLGVILGAAIGAVMLILCIFTVVLCRRRKRGRRQHRSSASVSSIVTPFITATPVSTRPTSTIGSHTMYDRYTRPLRNKDGAMAVRSGQMEERSGGMASGPSSQDYNDTAETRPSSSNNVDLRAATGPRQNDAGKREIRRDFSFAHTHSSLVRSESLPAYTDIPPRDDRDRDEENIITFRNLTESSLSVS